MAATTPTRQSTEHGRADTRLASSTSLSPRVSTGSRLLRPHAGLIGLSFFLTLIGYLANVQRMSPVDVLPFAWTWLAFWLGLSVMADLWSRFGYLTSPRRRRRPDATARIGRHF